MTLDAELLEILVCPNDRGDIDYHEDEQVIVCRTCRFRYPVRDGIPVMLIDEAEKPGGASGAKPEPKRGTKG
ncbi:MAG TPA: Trm112 family protein [Actinomycetota bacterium]|nr:Trm112 family protein [Actinomycetota bacterium]